jgi:hypothetical protein
LAREPACQFAFEAAQVDWRESLVCSASLSRVGLRLCRRGSNPHELIGNRQLPGTECRCQLGKFNTQCVVEGFDELVSR